MLIEISSLLPITAHWCHIMQWEDDTIILLPKNKENKRKEKERKPMTLFFPRYDDSICVYCDMVHP